MEIIVSSDDCTLDATLRAVEIRIDAAALARLDEMFPGPGRPAPEAYAW